LVLIGPRWILREVEAGQPKVCDLYPVGCANQDVFRLEVLKVVAIKLLMLSTCSVHDFQSVEVGDCVKDLREEVLEDLDVAWPVNIIDHQSQVGLCELHHQSGGAVGEDHIL